MISSQIGSLDKIFSGGLQNGMITEISGLRGTGKTQLALQFGIQPLSENKNILFIDTTVEFRPERFLQMIQSRNLPSTLLENLHISHVTNTQKQIEILERFQDDDFSLIIIDNITDLFSFEYSKKEQLSIRHHEFMNYMHALSQLAINKKIPVILTNQLMQANNIEYEKMHYSISNFTHQKIKLEKIKNHYQGTVFSPHSQKTHFFYKIEKMGLVKRS